MQVNIFVKIDVGLHRCGLQENDPNLLKLAQSISEDDTLNFRGILSHAGHAYASRDAAEVRKAAQEENALMCRVHEQLNQHGIEVPEVSVGSTPTILVGEVFEGITEIRPGNYVFMDRTQLNLGIIEPERIALSVLATVVSANADYFIVDAGSKVLSSDTSAHGNKTMTGYGLAYPVDHFQAKSYELPIVRLSEEHGFVARGDFDLPLGSRMRIVPNHACVVANLTDSYTVAETDQVVDQWKVAARGQVH